MEDDLKDKPNFNTTLEANFCHAITLHYESQLIKG
jgi:hypothetical protein